MITRRLRKHLPALLAEYPAVALLGPRQVGKTTLAHGVAEGVDSVYINYSCQMISRRIEEELHRLSAKV